MGDLPDDRQAVSGSSVEAISVDEAFEETTRLKKKAPTNSRGLVSFALSPAYCHKRFHHGTFAGSGANPSMNDIFARMSLISQPVSLASVCASFS